MLAGSALAAGPALVRDPQDSPGGLDIQRASFSQTGALIDVDVATYGEWGARTLAQAQGRSLCVALNERRGLRVCVVPKGHGRQLTLDRQSLDAHGNAGAPHPFAGDVLRRGRKAIRIEFSAKDAGLPPGRATWQVASTWTGDAACPTADAPGCTDLAPDSGPAPTRIQPYRPVGCRAAGTSLRHAGPGHRRREIALTFDDGPAADTPQYLDILEREHVPATFFMIGRQVAGHGALLHRMLADGFMIGNHTWDHANVAGGATWELDRTQAAIRQASGFTPCLFRPPYGAVGPNLVSDARARGMLTIVWNDDPQDWRTPGTGVIFDTVMREARPDGIVLMHDGGGPRGQTIAALPRIIHALRARGYAFVTVADLLGLKTVYG